ncbi:MAG: hypothetical protein DMF84_30450 [Acidobacteria bacterium]|nr:MAG: hypothetical protein DMF84_30450 [Acidobacteriota bacterium]
MDLPHTLDRTILIEAPRDLVFRYFTDNARWSAWWGAGSTIDARPGGRVFIRLPGAVEVTGEIVEVAPPTHIVFTYGFVSGKPIPPGTSRVSIRLETVERGTRVSLSHEFADAAVRDEFVQGWRYQLSLFANVVADEVHGDVERIVDTWFAALAETNEGDRQRALESVATPDVRMRDRFSCIDGLDELAHHVTAAQRFMPGMRLQKSGAVRHCQGTALADWTAVGPDGQPRGQGTNVFALGPDGRIESVTGFWSQTR